MSEPASPSEELAPPSALVALEGESSAVGWQGWAGLAAAGLVIAAAVAWGIFGDVPTRVAGRCILMLPEGVADVTADASGRVTSLLVKTGDKVTVRFKEDGDKKIAASIAPPAPPKPKADKK